MSDTDIDISLLRATVNGNKAMMIKIISIFIEEALPQLHQMEKAALDKDWMNVYRIAHKMKPNVLLIGINRLKQKIADVEQNAKAEKNTSAISEQIQQIKTELPEVIKELIDIKTDLEQG